MEHDNKRKKLLAGIFALLLIGVGAVGASVYYAPWQAHRSLVGAQDFDQMHAAMMRGDYETAEAYHEEAGNGCPMHDEIVNGAVSPEEFSQMHEWMMSGDFPQERPEGISEEAWELHVSHHPEAYG